MASGKKTPGQTPVDTGYNPVNRAALHFKKIKTTFIETLETWFSYPFFPSLFSSLPWLVATLNNEMGQFNIIKIEQEVSIIREVICQQPKWILALGTYLEGLHTGLAT